MAKNSGDIYTVNIKEFEKKLEDYIDPYEIDGALFALKMAAEDYEAGQSSIIAED